MYFALAAKTKLTVIWMVKRAAGRDHGGDCL